MFCIYNNQINLEKTNNMILTVSNILWKFKKKKSIKVIIKQVEMICVSVLYQDICNVCLERIWEKDCIIEKKKPCVTNLLKHICICEIEVARVCWKYRVRFNISRPLSLLPLHVLDSFNVNRRTYVTPAVMNLFNILVVVCEFFCSIGSIQCALIISNFTNSFELIK